MERLQSTGPSAKISRDGELPCILVYSSRAHVKYIEPVLDLITEYLQKNNFRTILLRDEAKSLGVYSEEFLRAAKDCVLGVVILDGFRPNVLFEFGVLIGLKKPIILLKDKNAEINIKTLYGDLDSRNCKSLTGLSHSQFKDLKNPPISSSSCSQFSDLSTSVPEYDHDVSKSDPKHIVNQLSSNISRIKPEIEKEGEKILGENAPESMSSSFIERYQEHVARLYSLLFSSIIEENDIDSILNDFKNLEKDTGIKMPSKIHSLIASLYSSLAERTERNDD